MTSSIRSYSPYLADPILQLWALKLDENYFAHACMLTITMDLLKKIKMYRNSTNWMDIID